MKQITLLCAVALMAAACSSPDTKTTNSDSTATAAADGTLTETTGAPKTSDTTAITSLCFVRTEGAKNQDSTTVNLVMRGSSVTGEMMWLPAEKDRRKGVLSGTRKDDLITAVWTFKQEGMTDTIGVEFQLKKDQLLQRPLITNTKTGRQQTDKSAGYTLAYEHFMGTKK